MTTKILIMGLPGAGKTTLANKLVSLIGTSDVLWLNADEVRTKFNDWDFSTEGRIRQSKRMRELADNATTEYTVVDFVAPLIEMRDNFAADWTIWVDTIESGRFEDTNKAFIPPTSYDFRITEKNAEKWATFIWDHIKCNKRKPVCAVFGITPLDKFCFL